MLAYIFWHWRYPHVDRDSYTTRLIEFHEALRARSPNGFRHSAVFQTEGVPWIGTDMEGYEDWYLVDGSATLDPLNEAATSGACEEPHRQVARCAAGGSGGLYQLRSGEPNVATSRFAMRFPKPAGMIYEDLYAALQPATNRSEVSLWRRQMALGPAPEFCLLSPTRQELPGGFEGLCIPWRRIWPGT